MLDDKKLYKINGQDHLVVGTITFDNHSYYFLSPVDDEKYLLCEVNSKNNSLIIVQDPDKIAAVQEYYQAHPESLK